MSGNTEGTEIFRASIPDGRLEPVVRTARRAVFPVPSPDGRGLFYGANPDSLDLSLWWRDLDSGRDVRVTTGVGEYAEATISADGRLIVGTVLDVRQSLERVAVRFDQKVTLEPVTDGYTGDFDPAWFPDGSRMVLSSSRTGQRNIWTTAAGSPAAPITTGSAIDERPVVSPDGTQIAFVSDRGGHRGIWTVSASGGTPRLASTVDVIDTISWSPDGQRLVYSTPRGDDAGTGDSFFGGWSFHAVVHAGRRDGARLGASRRCHRLRRAARRSCPQFVPLRFFAQRHEEPSSIGNTGVLGRWCPIPHGVALMVV